MPDCLGCASGFVLEVIGVLCLFRFVGSKRPCAGF